MRGQIQTCSNHTQQTWLLCWTQRNIVFRLPHTVTRCHGAGGPSPGPCSVPGYCWDLWWTTQRDTGTGLSPSITIFLPSVSFQKCAILIRLSKTNAKLTWQLTASFSTTPKSFRYVLVTGCVFVSWGENATDCSVAPLKNSYSSDWNGQH